MESLLETVVTAVVAFTATNVDDLFIIMLLFSQRNKFTTKEVYAGQLLGMSTLILLSLSGIVFALIVPLPYIGLLGFFPIYLALKELFSRDDDDDDDVETTIVKKSVIPFLTAGTVSVAFIAIANGGDNVGVYIPLFTSQSPMQLSCMIGIFLLMTFLWVRIGQYMSYHPLVAKGLERYNHIIFPLILIGLGIYIFIECGTYSLISNSDQP